MNYSYAVYDDKNRLMMQFGGPCRLAKWNPLLPGWSIERFIGTISQGMVSLDDVKTHAAELECIDHGHTDPTPNQMAY